MPAKDENVTIIATNRKAHHDYEVEDRVEAGVVLEGTEVKSLRGGNCSIGESFARARGEELFLFDMHIPPYKQAGLQNHEPKRPRKLLLHRREIGRLMAQCARRGYTLVPLSIYFRNGLVKVDLALARRRPKGDKRRQLEKEMRRQDIRSAVSRRRKR